MLQVVSNSASRAQVGAGTAPRIQDVVMAGAPVVGMALGLVGAGILKKAPTEGLSVGASLGLVTSYVVNMADHGLL